VKHVLLGVAASTPQIVTETLWCLMTASDPPRRFDEVHVVSTESTIEKARLLCGDDGAIARLAEDLGLNVPDVFLHVLAGPDGEPLRDIRSAWESAAFSSSIVDLVRKLTMNPDSTLYASIAGGRKTMGFLLGQAMALFARPQDQLTHVLVEEKFENCEHFWFPTREPKHLVNGKGTDVDASQAQPELATVPFVRLRGKLTPRELRAAVVDPGPIVQRIQQSIETAQVTLEIASVGAPMYGLRMLDRPLAPALASMSSGCSLTLRVILGDAVGTCGVRVLLDCCAHADQAEEALLMAQALAEDVRHALEKERTGYRVIDCTRVPSDILPDWTAWLVPGSRVVGLPQSRKLTAVASEAVQNAIRFRIDDRESLLADLPVQAMSTCGIPMEFRWSIERFEVGQEERELVNAIHVGLAGVERSEAGEFHYGTSDVFSRSTHAALVDGLNQWKQTTRGFRTSVCLRAGKALPDALLAQVAGATALKGVTHAFHVGDMIERSEGNVLDLSSCYVAGNVVPFGVPSHRELIAAGLVPALPLAPRQLITTGVELGTSGDSAIRLSPKDRDQHMYVVGGSGTGKSTLLRNLVIQDIEAGEGVFMLDPHGDLIDDVLSNIPKSRAHDVVLLDVGDAEYPFGLNFLQPDPDNLGTSIAFITNELLGIFRQLYGSVPESMGPAFEQMFRAGVAALLDNDATEAPTFLRLLRFYTDGNFRKAILKKCRNPSALQVLQLHEKGSGDHNWENYSAYIINKFSQFTMNSRVRNVICQPTSTVDFRSVMDEGKIVLVKMSKGRLGEADVRLIGMLIVGRLFGAALSRADSATDARRTMNVYIDEFQNFVTGTIGQMLAEGRKYGLRMVLANQAMAQLDPLMRGNVLGNAANLLTFRLGPQDAVNLESYFRPTLAAGDLQSLPNFHCAARILKQGAPVLPPFVIQTRAPQASISESALPAEIIAYSRHHFARPRRELEADIALLL